MQHDLPAIAASEFRQRQTRARDAVARDKIDPQAARRHLSPWLAVAAAAGADLPELTISVNIIAPAPQAGQLIDQRLRSDEIAPRTIWLPLLAAARDKAIDACTGADASVQNRTRDLIALANHFGAPAYNPTPHIQEQS